MAYCSTSDVKTYLGISSTGDNALIGSLIGRAQKAIETYTRRVFQTSTANTTHRFTVGKDTQGRMLWLDDDLATISSVITDADSTAPSTVSTAEYITHPRNRAPYYAIEIRSDASEDWTFEDAPETGVTVAGKWGYSTTPPADVKHACIRLAAYYYRQKDVQVFDVTTLPETGQMTVPVGIPRDVKMILDPYVRIGVVMG